MIDSTALHKEAGRFFHSILLLIKKIQNLFRTDRLHIIGVDSHIIPQNTIPSICQIIIFIIMLVPMKRYCTFSDAVPFFDRIRIGQTLDCLQTDQRLIRKYRPDKPFFHLLFTSTARRRTAFGNPRIKLWIHNIEVSGIQMILCNPERFTETLKMYHFSCP